ncbi:MAG: sodium transporter [Alteromonadaceae bacterium]|nr:MAG: sodium transporter [Alteromonadaceae bacterium]
MHLSLFDSIIVIGYILVLLTLAYYLTRRVVTPTQTTKSYFLANRDLPWWAVGAALIGANISAEQIIALSADGYRIGMAVAAYEWGSAIILILVAKYLLPVYLRRGIYTLPQLLQQRYDYRLRQILALYWLLLYVFIYLTAVLWFGANAIEKLTGIPYLFLLFGLGLTAGIYGVYGGFKPLAYIDALHLVLLLFGCSAVTYLALDKVAQVDGGTGVIHGFQQLLQLASTRFDLVLPPQHTHYNELPGLSAILGGMLVLHMSYWGFNQFIVQRALAARSLREGQKGLLFTAAIKLFLPFIIVLPGVAAVVLLPESASSPYVYTRLVEVMPSGVKGIVVVVLLAGVLSSLTAIMNTIATLFTMDLYAFGGREQDQARLVNVGRICCWVAIAIAVVTAIPLEGDFDRAFFYIQQLSGVMAPGIVAVFLLGLLWSKAAVNGAYAAVICSVLMSLSFMLLMPSLPFINRVLIVFLLAIFAGIGVSLLGDLRTSSGAFRWRELDWTTGTEFKLGSALIVMGVLTVYYVWW